MPNTNSITETNTSGNSNPMVVDSNNNGQNKVLSSNLQKAILLEAGDKTQKAATKAVEYVYHT